MRFIINNFIKDFNAAFSKIDLVINLSWLDIIQRYRRTVIGPFWITFSNIIIILALTYIFSFVSNSSFYPLLSYIAVGYILWIYISTAIIESCNSFINSEFVIKQFPLPLSVHILRAHFRQTIVFGHILLILPIIYLHTDFHLSNFIYFLLSLILLSSIIFLISFFLAIISSRFRDVFQIVQNIFQLLFYVTPIVWEKNIFPKPFFIDFNPIYHLINLPREILLNNSFPYVSLYVNLFILTFCFIVTVLFFSKYHKRIVYWI